MLEYASQGRAIHLAFLIWKIKSESHVDRMQVEGSTGKPIVNLNILKLFYKSNKPHVLSGYRLDNLTQKPYKSLAFGA